MTRTSNMRDQVTYLNVTHSSLRRPNVVEPLLVGIVLGLIPITIAGLMADAYRQLRRDQKLGTDGG